MSQVAEKSAGLTQRQAESVGRQFNSAGTNTSHTASVHALMQQPSQVAGQLTDASIGDIGRQAGVVAQSLQLGARIDKGKAESSEALLLQRSGRNSLGGLPARWSVSPTSVRWAIHCSVN